MVGNMLDQLGYGVVRAQNAATALGLLSNNRHIDLVFTDIVMPGSMDGVALARELHSRCPRLPVVLTSGHPGTASRDIEAEGVKVLHKPYRLHELHAALGQALRSDGQSGIANTRRKRTEESGAS
jgi:DNA-binding NtrC family response regulator